MITINTISNTRFAFNGIQYLKNYISRIAGDRIEIYNCYEKQDVLLPLTLYSEVQLDGIVYNSAAELQQEILGVIYLRNTLDDAGISTQNNAGRYLPFGEIEGEGDITPAQVAIWINSQYFAFIVSDTATPIWLEFTRNGKKYIFNFIRGKGFWGYANGTGMGNNLPVNSGDFKLISVTQLTGDDVNNATGSTIISLGEIEDGDYLTAANSQERDFSDAGTFDENGNYISYYFSYTQDEVLYFVQFVGQPGIYGGAGLDSDDFSATDFVSSTNSEVQPTPGLQEVTDAGPNTTSPITIVGATSKLTYSSEGSSIISFEGNVINIKHDEPIAPEVNYTIPAKEEDDTFAMISDVEEAIDSQGLQQVIDNSAQATTTELFRVGSLNNSTVKGAIMLDSTGVVIAGEAGGVRINGDTDGVTINETKYIGANSITGDIEIFALNGGLKYTSDVSEFYTQRSLVDKGYVDSIAENQDLQQVLTNGSIANVIMPFNVSSQNNEFVKGSIKLLNDGVIIAGEAGGVKINGDTEGIFLDGASLTKITGSSLVVETGNFTKNGGDIRYVQDYSNIYTERSLVDKGYVDNEVATKIGNHPDTHQHIFDIWTGTHQEFEDYVNENGAFPETTQVFLEVEPINEMLFTDQGDGLVKALSIVNGVVTITEVI